MSYSSVFLFCVFCEDIYSKRLAAGSISKLTFKELYALHLSYILECISVFIINLLVSCTQAEYLKIQSCLMFPEVHLRRPEEAIEKHGMVAPAAVKVTDSYITLSFPCWAGRAKAAAYVQKLSVLY